MYMRSLFFFFFFQAEDGIRDLTVTGVQTCALPISRAGRDVALAQLARTRAVIEKKTIRAPFRARVGISDVHPGQYLNEGTELTTLQGVDAAANVDFTVAQAVAAELHAGDRKSTRLNSSHSQIS